MSNLAAFNSPVYDAGLDSGDVITAIGGQPATIASWDALRRRAPGDRVMVSVRRRDGKSSDRTLVVAADPALQIVPVERRGVLSAAQRVFREAWLGTGVR